jgi:tetratricopeptide (TPR) repeat protein
MMNQKSKKVFYIIVGLLVIFLFGFVLKTKNTNNKEELVDNSNTTTEQKEENKDILAVPSTGVNTLENLQQFNNAMNNATASSVKNDYNKAISYYDEALTYKKSDIAYAGLYTMYLNQKNWTKALDSIDQAISINPTVSDYWKWKILVMDEGLHYGFSSLRNVYELGYPKVKSEQKINLVTNFARLSENKGENQYSINLWQKAIELNPGSKTIYQSEIDRISKK